MAKIQLRRLSSKTLNKVEEYGGEDILNIYTENTTQLKPWIKVLLENKQIKKLSVSSNISQDCFDAICQLENLKELFLLRCTSLKNIDSIIKLKTLECLVLSEPTKIESIEPIGQLSKLEDLRIQNIKRVSNFDALSNLTPLKVLKIDGSLWRTQLIDNFNFLSKLTNIRYLTFVNSKANIKNFDPILNLKKLTAFHSSYNYPKEELEKLLVLDLESGNSNCLANPIFSLSFNELVDFFEKEEQL